MVMDVLENPYPKPRERLRSAGLGQLSFDQAGSARSRQQDVKLRVHALKVGEYRSKSTRAPLQACATYGASGRTG